jgi:hypothetical protein
MSIQKKSLISNRVAVRKALIASQPVEVGEPSSPKVNSLTAQSMKSAEILRMKVLKGRSLKVFKKA